MDDADEALADLEREQRRREYELKQDLEESYDED